MRSSESCVVLYVAVETVGGGELVQVAGVAVVVADAARGGRIVKVAAGGWTGGADPGWGVAGGRTMIGCCFVVDELFVVVVGWMVVVGGAA